MKQIVGTFVIVILATSCLPKSKFNEGASAVVPGSTGGGTTGGTTGGSSSSSSSSLPDGEFLSNIRSNKTSPNVSRTPNIKADSPSYISRVYFYTDALCNNAVTIEDDTTLTNGISRANLSSTGITIKASFNSLTEIWAKAKKTDNTYTDCSDDPVFSYRNIPAGDIVFESAMPASPSRNADTTPSFKGTILNSLVTSIEFYRDNCGGTPIATVDADLFTSTTGAEIPVTANNRTSIYAKGVGTGYSGTCKPFAEYIHDTTAPTASGLAHKLFSSSTTVAPDFTWTGSDPLPGSGIQKYQYAIGRVAGPETSTDYKNIKDWTDVSSNSLTALNLGNALSDGTYYIHIKALDQAGNASSVMHSSWKIKNPALSFAVTTPAAPTVSGTTTTYPSTAKRIVTFTGTCFGPNDITVTYPTGASGNATVACSSLNNNFSFDVAISGDAGLRTLTLVQNDGTANISITRAINFQPLSAFGLAIAAAENHSCGMKGNKLYCWGDGQAGQLGDGAARDNLTPDLVRKGVISSSISFAQVSSGYNHGCALTEDKKAYCWGDNTYGQLGRGTASTQVPLDVNMAGVDSNKFIQISSGFYHNCALTETKKVYCWGWNNHKQLGSGVSEAESNEPELVPMPSAVRQVATGGWHSCALLETGDIYCWGYNGNGMLGDGSTTETGTPQKVMRGYLVDGDEKFTYVSAGSYQTCATTNYYNGYCWGYNGNGALGTGDTTSVTAPHDCILNCNTEQANPSGVAFVKIATMGGYGGNAAYHMSCAITRQGKLYCWGINAHGQLGLNSTSSVYYPREVVSTALLGAGANTPITTNLFTVDGLTLTQTATSATQYFEDVVIGGYHACARTNLDNTFCWGHAANGRLGNGLTTPNKLTPVLVNYPN